MQSIKVTAHDAVAAFEQSSSVEPISTFQAGGISVTRWKFEPEEVAALRAILSEHKTGEDIPLTVLLMTVGNPPPQSVLVSSGNPDDPLERNILIAPVNSLLDSLAVHRATLTMCTYPDGKKSLEGITQREFMALNLRMAMRTALQYIMSLHLSIKDVNLTENGFATVHTDDGRQFEFAIDATTAYAVGGLQKVITS